MYRVLVSDYIHEDGIQILKQKGLHVDIRTDITSEELQEIIGNYDVLIVRSRTKVRRDVIEKAKKLKIIARAGTGLDNIDVNVAREKGIKVINTPEGPSRSVAELVIALIFALFRNITTADRSMKAGKWIKKQLIGNEIKGKKLGIIGFGRIGREVAKIAKALGMEIMAYDVIDVGEFCKEIGAKKCNIGEILRNADVITLHLPLTENTKNFLDLKKIKLMKKGSYLINTSRGGVINNDALLWGLENDILKGVALDVYTEEPPKSEILKKIIEDQKVIATPHIGGNTIEALRNNSIIIVEKIIKNLESNR